MLVETNTSRSFLELTCILEKEDIDKMVVAWRYVIIYYYNASFMIYLYACAYAYAWTYANAYAYSHGYALASA